MFDRRFIALSAPAAVLVAATGVMAFQAAGTVSGRVTDENGHPMANVRVTARYQSNGGGVSYSRTAWTDSAGRYSIRVADRPGAWSVHADARVGEDGRTMTINLTPSNTANFASNAATTRNFTVRFNEQTADNPYGDGGMLVVASAIGDYTPLDEVEMTLRPTGGGAPIVRRLRQTGEGWVLTGLRPQTYEVSARHGGRPMMVSAALTPSRDYRWGASYTGGFERTGPGIYQLRIEVKAR